MAVGKFKIKGSGVEAFPCPREPLLQLLRFVLVQAVSAFKPLQGFLIAPHSTAVFRRAGSLTFQTDRNRTYLRSFDPLLDNDFMNPVIAEVVNVLQSGRNGRQSA